MPRHVSIIIPNWHGGTVIRECVESILLHTRVVDFEIIVIDNGSIDESRREIRGLADREPRLRAILNDRNAFFARACNQGYLVASGGRHLLVANNDILLRGDAVSVLVA